MKTLVHLVGVALAVATGTTAGPVGEPVQIYGDAAEFIELAPHGPGPDFQLRRYGAFQQGASRGHVYFAAYARSSLGSTGIASDFNRLEDAKEVALQRCHARLPDPAHAGDTCQVIGIWVPKGYAPTDGMTLGHGAHAGFLKYQERAAPKAFAIGSRENWAAHGPGKDLEWARARALANCTWEGGRPPGRAYGGADCVIIDEER